MPGELPASSPLTRNPSARFWLGIILLAGLFLYLLDILNGLLSHLLMQTAGAALAIAVFLVGWNTRLLVQKPALLILAIGTLGATPLGLLHIFTFPEMSLLPGQDGNLAAQFWLGARSLTAFAFLASATSLGRQWPLRGELWLGGCFGVALLLALCSWPLGIFPDCLLPDGQPTPFKTYSEYLLAVVLACAGLLIWVQRTHLAPLLTKLLLLAIVFGIFGELSWAHSPANSGLPHFLGHYLRLIMLVIISMALVWGTLRNPFETLFRELSASHQNLAEELERRRRSEREKRMANQEIVLLYRMARAFHSTLRLDALSHLILSAATAVDGGGFRRAMLFTVNERAGVVQGMLGVDAIGAEQVLPGDDRDQAWDTPRLNAQTIHAQRAAAFNLRVVKQRLPLDGSDNPLARAYLESRVIELPAVNEQTGALADMVRELELGSAIVTPLFGRHQIMGVLVAEVSEHEDINAERLRFFEMFARQAGDAMENAQLLYRLERAHEELRDVQERLIEGEKLSVLGEMAAQVAHELKNPLVSIGGFAQRLEKMKLGDAKASEYAGIIGREVRRLEKMLQNILAFSKQQLVCLEECDFGELLRETVDLERENCDRQAVEVDLEIPADLPSIIGDCQQLRQVMLNLIINARQAMSEGGQMIVRANRGLLRGDPAVVLEVEDTGGGIPPHIMRNIFNPFFTTQVKGTGLGLSISHRIIMHHQGEIEVINSEAGARFIVRLPVQPPGAMTR